MAFNSKTCHLACEAIGRRYVLRTAQEELVPHSAILYKDDLVCFKNCFGSCKSELRSGPNAGLASSQALACDEFLSLVQPYGDPDHILGREKSGVKEMVNTLRILNDRKNLTQIVISYLPPLLSGGYFG